LKLGLDTSVLIASIKKRGEKHHSSALELGEKVKKSGHIGVASSLVLIELPSALATTKMPVEKIYETELSLEQSFNLEIMSYEDYIDRTLDLIFEFRDLKRRLGIGAADFHHLATSISEGCSSFVTVDEKHLLRNETREALRKHIEILGPQEAVQRLRE
jgi:predicted nucleic acid-binding protein